MMVMLVLGLLLLLADNLLLLKVNSGCCGGCLLVALRNLQGLPAFVTFPSVYTLGSGLLRRSEIDLGFDLDLLCL